MLEMYFSCVSASKNRGKNVATEFKIGKHSVSQEELFYSNAVSAEWRTWSCYNPRRFSAVVFVVFFSAPRSWRRAPGVRQPGGTMSFDDVTLYGRDDEMDEFGDNDIYDENLEEEFEDEEEEEEQPAASGEAPSTPTPAAAATPAPSAEKAAAPPKKPPKKAKPAVKKAAPKKAAKKSAAKKGGSKSAAKKKSAKKAAKKAPKKAPKKAAKKKSAKKAAKKKSRR
jgi:hypothetical protein